MVSWEVYWSGCSGIVYIGNEFDIATIKEAQKYIVNDLKCIITHSDGNYIHFYDPAKAEEE